MYESPNNPWQPKQDINLLKNIDSSYDYIKEYLNGLDPPEDLVYAKKRLLTLVNKKQDFKFNRPFQLWEAVKFLEGLAKNSDNNKTITGVLDLATGSGKTYTFLLLVCILVAPNLQGDSQIPQKFNKTLVVVPTLLLQDQTIEKWSNIFPEYAHLQGLRKMKASPFDNKSKAMLQVVCQNTLSLINNNRGSQNKTEHLKKFISEATITIYDEAHLTYRYNIVECLKAKTMLAVSATASYPCGSIKSVYDEAKKFGSVIRLPVLDVKSASCHNIITKILLTKCHFPIPKAIVKTPENQDYEIKISNALNKIAYFDAICEIYAKEARYVTDNSKDHFFFKKTIIFCTNIDGAEKLCERFNYWYEQKWKQTKEKMHQTKLRLLQLQIIT